MKDKAEPGLADVPETVVLVLGEIALPGQSRGDSVRTAKGLTIIRCAENWDGALSLLRRFNASILIASQSFVEQLPDGTILQLARSDPSIRVLAILEGSSRQNGSALKMLRFGCKGILPSRFSSTLLRRAVGAILNGELWAPPRLVSELVSDLLIAAYLRAATGLTSQEARILDLISQGYTNSELADALFISPETVRWHKRRLNRKLNGRTARQGGPSKIHPTRRQAAG